MVFLPPRLAVNERLLPPGVLLNDILDAVKEAKNAGTTQAIEHLETPFVVFENSGCFENRQVLRNSGKVRADFLAQLTHATFAL